MTTEGATSTRLKTLRPLSGSSSALRSSTTCPEGSLRLQQRNITGNRDGFVLAADRKGNVHPGRLLNEDDDVFPVYALESGLFNGKAIVAGTRFTKEYSPLSPVAAFGCLLFRCW